MRQPSRRAGGSPPRRSGPASSNSTDADDAAATRPATTQPAAPAPTVGDNIGYVIGRTGGRRLFTRPGPFERHRRDVLQRGEPFFATHGPKAVFFGRWITGLRIAASWLAGMNRMEWKTFFFWNALGGICWAISVGLLGYF